PGIALIRGLLPERFDGLPAESGGELSGQPGRVALSSSLLLGQERRHRERRRRPGGDERPGERISPAGRATVICLRCPGAGGRFAGGHWKRVPLSPHVVCRLLSALRRRRGFRSRRAVTTTPQIDLYWASYGGFRRATSPFFGTERISPKRGSRLD